MELTEKNTEISRNRVRATILLCSFVLAKFLLQYHLVHPKYELHRDEFLHLDQGRHLAWGFQSVPPVTSWVSEIIRWLGNSEFWVRFFPAMFGALTLIVVWKIVETLYGDLFACILACTGLLFSVLLRINILYQPNSLDILCWVTVYYLFIKYLDQQQPRWIFGLAVVFALGFLNKYNIIFLVLGLIPATLLTPQREIWKRKEVYAAGLLALVLVSPHLGWQIRNDFPFYVHLKELAARHLVHVNRWNFLVNQLYFFIGSLPVWVAGLAALIFYPPFRKYRLFLGSFFFTLLIFVFFKAKDYYAIGLYPLYIALGSVFISNTCKEGWKRVFKWVLLILPLLFFGIMYQVVFPNRSPEYIVNNGEKYRKFGMLRWEDGKEYHLPQDFADMLGWKELASKVDGMYRQIAHSGSTLVLCDNYGQAGAINYYSEEEVKAVSLHADYIDWIDLSIPYKNVIRVVERKDKIAECTKLSPHFKVVLSDSLGHAYAREHGAGIFGFIDAQLDVNEVLKGEILERKAARRLANRP